jgi:anti-sigma B factor antagonist
MVRALSGRSIIWRGTDLGGGWRATGDEAADGLVESAMDKPGEIAIVNLPDCIDSMTALSVEKEILEKVYLGARVIVDGSGVTYRGAAGVRALVTVLHRAEEAQAQIVFCRFSGPAADCLLVSGFSRLLEVADSIEEATVRLRPGRVAEPGERLHARGTAG